MTRLRHRTSRYLTIVGIGCVVILSLILAVLVNWQPDTATYSSDEPAAETSATVTAAIENEHPRTRTEGVPVTEDSEAAATTTPPPPAPKTTQVADTEPNESEGVASPSRGTCLSGEAQPFYVDPTASVIREVAAQRAAGNTANAVLLAKIACEPLAVWLMGERTIDETRNKIEAVYRDIGSSGNLPVFVLYNRATHDRATWESGRAGESYLNWIRAVGEAVGDRKAWVILEPDALATAGSYDAWHQAARAAELGTAVAILGERPHIQTYIDAGHSHWLKIDEAVRLLQMANIENAHGFSLNVANYRHTEDEIAYGTNIARELPDTHFVIDTGRSGNGPHPDALWCNAPDRAIGERPQLITNDPYLDAYLWVKPPGESDGTCEGGPPAGKFWLPYALGLIKNAEY